ANDKAVLITTAYEPTRCNRGTPQLIEPAEGVTTSGGVVRFQWSAVGESSAHYRLRGALEGARPTLLGVTDDTSVSLPMGGGQLEWWVEAAFSDCPSTISDHRRFVAGGRGPRLMVTYLAGAEDRPLSTAGPIDQASFRSPFGIAVSPFDGALYISDVDDSVIRRVADGTASIAAGSVGVASAEEGQFAKFNHPRGVAVTPLDGIVYVADTGNHSVRILYPGGPFIPA